MLPKQCCRLALANGRHLQTSPCFWTMAQFEVPPVCRSGYLLVVFGEVSEKSYLVAQCRTSKISKCWSSAKLWSYRSWNVEMLTFEAYGTLVSFLGLFRVKGCERLDCPRHWRRFPVLAHWKATWRNWKAAQRFNSRFEYRFSLASLQPQTVCKLS